MCMFTYTNRNKINVTIARQFKFVMIMMIGNPCKYITRKLTYDPATCMNCGVKNEDDMKNATQT